MIARGGNVLKPKMFIVLGMVGAGIVGVALGESAKPAASAAPAPPELNPTALTYKLADQIPWNEAKNGANATFIAYGDPDKPGLYVEFMKWHAHNGSRPHFHPNDRIIYVISGTWWVNTGAKYDPDHMTPMPAGTVVYHYGKGIHYDGAKDGDCVLEIVGEGPATTTPAEDKTMP
jgi:hypothetical protein